MKKLLYLLTILFVAELSIAQSSTVKIDMNASNWDLPEEAKLERFDNRETLLLNGKAIVRNQNFTNGTIEVDIYANSKRSFAGIIFRMQDQTMEEVYMRLHKSSQADAVQYTPIFKNETNWQLYREHQAMVSFKDSGWNTLRIEVENTSAEIFVNDEKMLTVDHLKTNHSRGSIGLTALFTNRFSNFRVTNRDDTVESQTEDNSVMDPNIISEWQISQAKPFNEEELDINNFSNKKYMTATTEDSGLLPISKYLEKPSSGNFEQNQEDYTIAYTTIHSDKRETKLFSFDYSDRIVVYLNGEPIFKGNNAFRAKGIQYMGHMDINTNKLYLPFNKGKNEIHCIVIDKANGWGIMAKLE
jgi:hypothetical protein